MNVNIFQRELTSLSQKVCHLYRCFSPSRYGGERYSGFFSMVVKDLHHAVKVPHMMAKEDLHMDKEVMEVEQVEDSEILMLETT